MNILSNMFQMEAIFRFGGCLFSTMHSAKRRTREGIHTSASNQNYGVEFGTFSRTFRDFGTTECLSLDGHIIK